MVRVYYDGKVWEARITLRENLFVETRSADPTRLVEIIRHHCNSKVVQICELQLECEHRLT